MRTHHRIISFVVRAWHVCCLRMCYPNFENPPVFLDRAASIPTFLFNSERHGRTEMRMPMQSDREALSKGQQRILSMDLAGKQRTSRNLPGTLAYCCRSSILKSVEISSFSGDRGSGGFPSPLNASCAATIFTECQFWWPLYGLSPLILDESPNPNETLIFCLDTPTSAEVYKTVLQQEFWH